MRFTTYSKFVPELADAVNLQALLDQLSDFLLQSGFAGGSNRSGTRATRETAAPSMPSGRPSCRRSIEVGPAHA